MPEHQGLEGEEAARSTRAERAASDVDRALTPEFVPMSLATDAGTHGRGNRSVSAAVLQQMQRTCGNRAVQRYVERTSAAAGPAAGPAAGKTVRAPVQRHAAPEAEQEFKEGAQAELDEQAQQSVAAVEAQDAGQAEDTTASVQPLRVTEPTQVIRRAATGNLQVQRDPKKSSLDKDAQAIVDAAQDQNVPIDERAKKTVQAILDKYYSADKANVDRIVYVQDDPGLTTSWDPPASNPKPFMKVGDQFVNATTAAHFSRKVLQVGHEIQHVRQFKTKTPGLGEKFKHEREFLAFYWESTAPTVAGTGKEIGHSTRVDLIDAALGHLCCLPAGSYAAEKKALLDLRLQHDGVDKSGKNTLPTTSPPTTCPK